LSPESGAVIATCETELATGPDPLRAARLHYEIARAYETASGWLEDAAKHYRESLERAPEYLPAIRGARRTDLARDNVEAALAHFDAEDKLTSSRKRKAMLAYQKGPPSEERL